MGRRRKRFICGPPSKAIFSLVILAVVLGFEASAQTRNVTCTTLKKTGTSVVVPVDYTYPQGEFACLDEDGTFRLGLTEGQFGYWRGDQLVWQPEYDDSGQTRQPEYWIFDRHGVLFLLDQDGNCLWSSTEEEAQGAALVSTKKAQLTLDYAGITIHTEGPDESILWKVDVSSAPSQWSCISYNLDTIMIDTEQVYFRGESHCLDNDRHFGLDSNGSFGFFHGSKLQWAPVPVDDESKLVATHWFLERDGTLVLKDAASGSQVTCSLLDIDKRSSRNLKETRKGSMSWFLHWHDREISPTGKGNATTIETGKNDTSADRLMYLAYYYPWYLDGDWSRHETQDIPLLGYYGTDLPQLAEQHIEWALRGNISSWVVSWGGTDTLSKRHFDQGMLSASNIDKIKFCMFFESKALKGTGFQNGTAQARLLKDLQEMKKEYFDHPSYLRLNGRPVVAVYITRWRAMFDEYFNKSVLDDLRAAIDEDIFFIGDEPFFGNGNDDPATSHNGLTSDGTTVFDAYTTYNMFENDRVIPNETASDYMLREAMPIFQAWSEETLFFPNVIPMYHDFRGKEPLLGDADDFLRQLYAVACLPRPEWVAKDIPKMVFVTSFNEWWEGTQVEPDEADRYGFDFLDALASFKVNVSEEGYSWCP